MAHPPGGTRRALLGFSGVDITLIENRDGAFVRKQARHAGQNERLRGQAAKLAWAHAAGIPCPAPRAEGLRDGLFWFDMDYVPGESLANGLVSGRAIDWPEVAALIGAMLDRFRTDATGTIDPAGFPRKLDDIVRRCAGRGAVRAMLDRVERAAAVLARGDWSGLPQGPAHGDLTLENMLLRPDGSVMFIDFDVPAQESVALDIGKLYQDLKGQWFLRHLAVRDPEGVDLLNARLNLVRAVGHFEHVLAGFFPGDAARLPALAAFHLLRTLPYATDPAVGRYVLDRVDALVGAG
ncbi:MAG TPA: phosphotransferase [Rhodopila sp.]|uniref:phosphotransferase n=1 Tax=Rhodopila sp. TaxID=2480087 RepID=UPI002C9240D1|nr:phosphotransferase [Rhodopila sp.]HVY15778.1 phosphotransferase [Rhodopila sp.]